MQWNIIVIKNGTIKLAGKWIEQEKKIIPSEETHTHKDKYSLYSLTCGY